MDNMDYIITLIIIGMGFLLIILAVFSKYIKCINNINERTTRSLDNLRIFGVDQMCKTAPSTPVTSKV